MRKRILFFCALAAASVLGAVVAGALVADEPDIAPDMVRPTPVPASASLESVRAADPRGGEPWAIRVHRASGGRTCVAVGVAHGGRLGVVEADGRFSALPLQGPDHCADLQEEPAQFGLAGVRGADGGWRTLLAGVAGAKVSRVTLVEDGKRRTLGLSEHRAFLEAFDGNVSFADVGVEFQLTDGSLKRFGASA